MESRLIEMVIEGAAVALVAIIAWIFNESRRQMVRLTDSVSELNLKMAHVVHSLKSTESQLSSHQARIDRLETVTMQVTTTRQGRKLSKEVQ
jgi:predicted  nucleic acid-binding Zn-ribbon protein